jgi:F-type H+-transporting ATPase subunit alpha
MEEQVCVIYAGVKGYLDDVPVNLVGKFETDLLRNLRGENKALLETIRKEEKLSDGSEAKLKDVIATVKHRLV